jgi:predicted amidohydrolase
MERLRVAALQYFIRPVSTFRQFEEQVEALLDTAADYRCQLVVLPEYFCVQLLTLGDTRRPMREQIRSLADQAPAVIDAVSRAAQRHGLYVVAGTVPERSASHPDTVHNHAWVCAPNGARGLQGKLHMTRFEREEWHVSPDHSLRIFEAPFGKFAVAICYDVEFPEIARAAARAGADILCVPSCTDDRQGFWRVRYCAHARAIENQMYVINAGTVGSLPQVPAVSLNYGLASILTPSDFPFARDGILAEGNVNQEMMVIGDLNLDTIRRSREEGTVLPLLDSERTAELVATPVHVPLA